MKVTIVQLNSQDDLDANLRMAEALIRTSHADFPADLYILPEYAPFGGGTAAQKRAAAEIIPTGVASRCFRWLAAELRTTIHCGTINECAGETLYNTSVVFGPDGSEICRYRKICLFEGTLPDGREILETTLYKPGRELVTFEVGGVRFGCTVCYDVRFPELYRELRRRGAHVVIFVAAMSRSHGEAHLEALLRARAIENQVYVLAAEQCGTYSNGTKANYGNSMIVDPWGRIAGRLGDEIGVLNFEIDMRQLTRIRVNLPIMDVANRVDAVIGRTSDFALSDTGVGLHTTFNRSTV